jgi:cytochrome P450
MNLNRLSRPDAFSDICSLPFIQTCVLISNNRFNWSQPGYFESKLLMGVADADAPDIKRWSSDYIRVQNPGWSVEEQRAIGQSVVDYYNYMLKLVKHYTRHPVENLISAAIEARQSDAEPLSDEEIAGLTLNLVLAGHETTAALIGNTLYSLLPLFHDSRQRKNTNPAAVLV